MLNVNHISYICNRSGAVINTNKDFGVFGKVKELGNIEDIQKFEIIKNHIAKKSDEKTTIYKAIISLSENDALQNGFDKRENWEKLLKSQYSNIAKEMKIKSEDFEYLASLHMEKGHPHIHIMFWDKNQEIQKGAVHYSRLNNIRKHLEKDVFKDEIQKLYNKKDEDLKEFKGNTKSALDDFNVLFGLSKDDYKMYKDNILGLDVDTNKSKIFDIKLDNEVIKDITKDIYNLKNIIGKKGRLSYGFMTSAAKAEIDNISKKLIDSNLELETTLHKYRKSKIGITKFHTKNPKMIEKEKENIEKEINKILGNQILQIYKKIGSKEWSVKKEDFEESKQNYAKNEVATSLVFLVDNFTRQTNQNKQNLKNEKGKATSEQAKKDNIKKSEQKSSIDWER